MTFHICLDKLLVSRINLFLIDFKSSNTGFSLHSDNDAPMLSNIKHVPLSQSVDVTMPKKPKDSSTGIKIVYDLEPIHKPRYKSDCFSQNGNIRKPRYVADRFGNHFVTLEVIFSIN
jgi:hypothetical protein